MSKKTIPLLSIKYNDAFKYEIGVDEAGRGPLLGRVYSGAVILPDDDSFQHNLMKDSKRFSSKKKILEVYNHIKEKAIAWSVKYVTEERIDSINIRRATHEAMHEAIKDIFEQLSNKKIEINDNIHLMIDGNDFTPIKINKLNDSEVPYVCIEGGDNKFTNIAAASIIAKVERDKYIEELCDTYPELETRYDLRKNKGYGTKKHLDGIKEHGISAFHRRTYGICKNY
jgi:ribonuclease HII